MSAIGMHVLSSAGTLSAPGAATRACRSRVRTMFLQLAPTARSLRLDTNDARVARYVRIAYGATLVESVSQPTDVAELSADKAIVSFNGADWSCEWAGPGKNPWLSGAYIVDQFVWRSLAREPDWMAIYACAVIVDGRAVLLAGETGVGKTTLGLALQRLGARLIGDEMIVVHPGDSKVDAIDRRLSVRLRSREPQADRVLAVDRRAFGALPPAARLAATFVVSRGEGEPAIAPAGLSRTALTIAPYAARRPNDLDDLARLAGVLAAGRCFTLRLGDANASARAVLEAVSTC